MSWLCIHGKRQSSALNPDSGLCSCPDKIGERLVTMARSAAEMAWDRVLTDELREAFDKESFVYGYAIGISQMAVTPR